MQNRKNLSSFFSTKSQKKLHENQPSVYLIQSISTSCLILFNSGINRSVTITIPPAYSDVERRTIFIHYYLSFPSLVSEFYTVMNIHAEIQ
jgi:hypothetical protein